MYLSPQEKQNEIDSYMMQFQINQYENSLPEMPRGQSDMFFKEVSRDFQDEIANIQLGFYVGTVPFYLLDIVARIINDIHNFDIALKIIVDSDEVWITSFIMYDMNSIGEASYNIMQANLKDQLLKTREIMKEILKKCEQCHNDTEKNDEELLKEVKAISKKIKKAFHNPDSDY